jgi:hypothetical protein
MRRVAGVAAGFLALTFFFAWPLGLAPGSRALDLGPDTRLFFWTMGWDLHALRTPARLFDANIFFPARGTLAYSENLLGFSLLAAPFHAATGDLVLSTNLAALLLCALGGLGAFVLARELGLGMPGALLAGMVYAFAPPRLTRLAQLHQIGAAWVPFCLAFACRYLRLGDRRDLWASAAVFSLQALTSGHGAIYAALSVAVLFAYRWGRGDGPRPGRLLGDFGAVGAAALVPAILVALPYVGVRSEGLTRDLAEAERWSPDVASFLASPSHVDRFLLGDHDRAKAYLFPGFAPLLLAALAWRGKRADRRHEQAAARGRLGVALLDGALVLALLAALAAVAGGIRWHIGGLVVSVRDPLRPLAVAVAVVATRLLVAGRGPSPLVAAVRAGLRAMTNRLGDGGAFALLLGVVSLWLALGPRFGLYTVAHAVVPGFDLVRVPSRFTTPTLLALGILAGLGLDRVRARGLPAALLLASAAEFAAVPLDARPYAIETPAIDRWLAAQPRPFAAVELPVADPRDETRAARLHSTYMLHSMAHWQPIVNGYSGHTPARHDRLFRRLASFPDDDSLSELEAMGVHYVVVHADLYPPDEWRSVSERLRARGERLRVEAEIEGGLAFRLVRSATRPQPQ